MSFPSRAGVDAIGRPAELRLVPIGRDHGDPAALALTMIPGATALRPLAPVHVRGARSAEGVRISFIRRTRIGGDNWASVETPLGEEREAYAIDILSGASVVRTLACVEPSALYAAADELADFGGVQTSLAVAVAQVSATIGRGFAASAVLAL